MVGRGAKSESGAHNILLLNQMQADLKYLARDASALPG
jgi:hypothetical protein